MTTPPQFREPTAGRANKSRVSIKDVAEATARAKVPAEVREAHSQALAGFQSENPGSTHRYGEVLFGDTIVDPTIQRPEQPDEIAALVRDFDPSVLGMITIWRRVVPAVIVDGVQVESEHVELVVIDGQQRRAAALLVGYDGPVHADVHDGLTRRDAARLFRKLNTRKAVNHVSQFKLALVEEDPHALGVQAVLDSLNIAFGTQKGYMAAKSAIRLIKRTNGATHLHWALRQVQRLYDRGAGGVYDGNVVEAFFMLHERYGNRIDEKRLFERLASDEGSNAGLVEFAQTYKRIHKGTLTVAIVRAIIDRYNKNLWKTSRAALPEWE